MNENNKVSENPDMPDGTPADETPQDNGHEARITALEAENQALKDRILRTMAEMENLRRRTEKEKADASLYGITKFARDMLNVADNLTRALGAVPQEARDGSDEALKALIEGVELTERDMMNQLERHGVKRISPRGEKFDPNFHQAMFEAPNPALPNNTVMEVIQDGYVIGERVLRPALVGVAKGGPKPDGQPAPQEAASRQQEPQQPHEAADSHEERPGPAGARVDRSI